MQAGDLRFKSDSLVLTEPHLKLATNETEITSLHVVSPCSRGPRNANHNIYKASSNCEKMA